MIIPKEAQDYYNLADLNIKKGEFRKALSFLKDALEIFPNYAEALSLLGYVHYKLKFKLLSKEEVFELSNKALKLNDKSPITWIHMGNAYSYLNKLDEAIECYQKVIEIGLENENLWNNLGSAYLKKKDYEKAFFYFNKVIESNPNFAPALNNIGYYYSMKKEYQKAIKLFDKAIKIDPNFSAPWNNKGNLHNVQQEYDKAIECYKKAFEIDPEDSHILNNIGTIYYFKKELDKALKYFEMAVNFDSSYGDPWINIGAIYSDKSNYKKAIESYEKAIALDQNLFKAWYNKGNVYLKKNDPFNAINSYKKAIKLNPSYEPAWTNMGNVYLNTKNFLEAKKCYKQAVQLSSNPIIEYFNLGNVYRFEGKFTKAIESYQKALDLNPNYEEAWYNQGLSYLLRNDYEMAIICLTEAININPRKLGTWGNLGIAFEIKKEYEKAIECYQKVLKLDPNDVLALNNIGHVYINKGNFKEAITFFKKALKINPNYIITLDNLGYAYYYKKDYNKAVEFYQIATDVFPYTPEIWINLGIAFNQLGNYEGALNCLNKAIELNPNDFIGHLNLGILFLNNFKYPAALKEFKKAISILKEKNFVEYLKQVKEFKNLTIKALELKPVLDKIDIKIKKLIKIRQIEQLIKVSSEIQKYFKEIIKQINLDELPLNTRDLLIAKFSCFEYLFNALKFNQIELTNLINTQKIFASNSKFINFFYAVQNINDVINLLKGYQNVKEISSDIQEKIFIAITTLEYLAGELTEVITGSIKKEQILIKPPPAKQYYSINEVKIKNFTRKSIKISLVQLDYELIQNPPFILKDRKIVSKKIIKALEFAEKDDIDIICFPELCFDKILLEEAKKFNEMIIIGGSYYNEMNYNVCPVIIYGAIYPIFKINPSYFENEIIKGYGMSRGSEIIIFQTEDNKFRFVVLICLDFIREGWYFVDGENKVNFIFVPSYNPARKKFQRNADVLCETFHLDIGISNRTEQKNEKFGGSCFICFENRSYFDYLVNLGYKKDDEITYKVIEAEKESMLIIELEPKEVEISKTPSTTPKILRIETKQYDGNNWVNIS